jgi:hypothetical protein
VTDEDSRRTAITQSAVDGEQYRLFERTVSAWQRGCQLAVDAAWPQFRSRCQLQSRAYNWIRDQTERGSPPTPLATYRAMDTLGGREARAANERGISKPECTAPTMRYNVRSETLFAGTERAEATPIQR